MSPFSVPRATQSPAIIFIDEIDAVGASRSRVSLGTGYERQTLNQLLAAMDGFSKNEGVIVIGTRSRCRMKHSLRVRISWLISPCAAYCIALRDHSCYQHGGYP